MRNKIVKRFTVERSWSVVLLAIPITAWAMGGEPVELIDAVSREVSVFNDLTNPVMFTDAVSREVSVYNDLAGPLEFLDAVSREVSVLSCAGDVNGDQTVDPLDSGFVLARFGCSVGTGDEGCDKADQNNDGVVDPLDVGAVLARFGECPE